MRKSLRKENFINYFKKKYFTFLSSEFSSEGEFRTGRLTSASLEHLYFYINEERKKWKRPHQKKEKIENAGNVKMNVLTYEQDIHTQKKENLRQKPD
jgi:hypothetical protein